MDITSSYWVTHRKTGSDLGSRTVQIVQLILFIFGVFFQLQLVAEEKMSNAKGEITGISEWKERWALTAFHSQTTCYLVFNALRDVHNLWISHKYMKNQSKERKPTWYQSDYPIQIIMNQWLKATQTNSPDRAPQTSPGLPIRKENLCSLGIAI